MEQTAVSRIEVARGLSVDRTNERIFFIYLSSGHICRSVGLGCSRYRIHIRMARPLPNFRMVSILGPYVGFLWPLSNDYTIF
jgi:hypothetical protein